MMAWEGGEFWQTPVMSLANECLRSNMHQSHIPPSLAFPFSQHLKVPFRGHLFFVSFEGPAKGKQPMFGIPVPSTPNLFGSLKPQWSKTRFVQGWHQWPTPHLHFAPVPFPQSKRALLYSATFLVMVSTSTVPKVQLFHSELSLASHK